MPRKPTRAELEAQNRELSAQNHVLIRALAHLRRGGSPEASVAVTYGGSYVIDLYDSKGALGGIVVQRFRLRGQSDTVTAHAFEEWADGWRKAPFTNESTAFKNAVGDLTAARNAILYAKESSGDAP